MRKKADNYLDTEATKLGYQGMLDEVRQQLENFAHTESIRAVLMDRKQHIEKRITELMQA